jgi:hypothetical protein
MTFGQAAQSHVAKHLLALCMTVRDDPHNVLYMTTYGADEDINPYVPFGVGERRGPGRIDRRYPKSRVREDTVLRRSWHTTSGRIRLVELWKEFFTAVCENTTFPIERGVVYLWKLEFGVLLRDLVLFRGDPDWIWTAPAEWVLPFGIDSQESVRGVSGGSALGILSSAMYRFALYTFDPSAPAATHRPPITNPKSIARLQPVQYDEVRLTRETKAARSLYDPPPAMNELEQGRRTLAEERKKKDESELVNEASWEGGNVDAEDDDDDDDVTPTQTKTRVHPPLSDGDPDNPNSGEDADEADADVGILNQDDQVRADGAAAYADIASTSPSAKRRQFVQRLT